MNEAENIGYLIPSEEIERFLADAEDKKYDGKLQMFDQLQTTENDALRKRLKMTGDVTGIMVTQPNTAEGYPLKPWDVITAIGEDNVDNDGQVQVRADLRLDFAYLIPKYAQDSKIPLTVWREGASVDVAVPLSVMPDYVLKSLDGTYPEYFVYGPIVLTPAYLDLMKALGSRSLPYFLATEHPILNRYRENRDFDGEELVVCRVLPHRITKGYDKLTFAALDKIDGVKVKNLEDAIAKLRDAKGEFLTFEYYGPHELMVFNRSDMESATEDLQDEEGIRKRGSEKAMATWGNE